MLAVKHGSPREASPLQKFGSPCPSENSASPPPPNSKAPPQLLKSSPQSHIFFQPPLFARGGGALYVISMVCF